MSSGTLCVTPSMIFNNTGDSHDQWRTKLTAVPPKSCACRLVTESRTAKASDSVVRRVRVARAAEDLCEFVQAAH